MDLFSSGLILSELLDPEEMRVPPCVLIQDYTPGSSDSPPEPRSDASSPENLPDAAEFSRILESESAREASLAAAASDMEENLDPPPSGWRILIVGGTRFETTAQTLAKDSQSMLATHLRHHPGQQVIRFDRDGSRFQHILNYLRSGTIFVEDLATLREVDEEAGYFQLQGLQELCRERILELQREKDEKRSRRSRELSEALIEALFRDSQHLMCLKRPAPVPIRARRLGDPPLATASPRFDLDADF